MSSASLVCGWLLCWLPAGSALGDAGDGKCLVLHPSALLYIPIPFLPIPFPCFPSQSQQGSVCPSHPGTKPKEISIPPSLPVDDSVSEWFDANEGEFGVRNQSQGPIVTPKPRSSCRRDLRGLAQCGGTPAWPALVTVVGLPTAFRPEFGKYTSGTGLSTSAHPCPSPGEHSQARGWLQQARLRGQHPITWERKGLLGSFQGERTGLNPSCALCSFFSMAGWKHALDTNTSTQLPGTAAARDLSELIFPLFSSLKS